MDVAAVNEITALDNVCLTWITWPVGIDSDIGANDGTVPGPDEVRICAEAPVAIAIGVPSVS